MSKFVTSKTTTDHLRELAERQAKALRLRRKLEVLETEIRQTEDWLRQKYAHQNLTARDENYVYEFLIADHTRRILDQDRAKVLLVNNGIRVPMKTCNVRITQITKTEREQ